MVLNVALSIIACQRHDPLVLSLLSLLVYTVCALITHDRWFEILAAILVVTFLLLGCLGSSLVWSTRKIQKENLDLKKEDEELFAVFNLRREQVKAYVKLAEQEMTDDKIGAVFDILGRKAQKNVMYNMKRYFFSKNSMKMPLVRLFLHSRLRRERFVDWLCRKGNWGNMQHFAEKRVEHHHDPFKHPQKARSRSRRRPERNSVENA